MQHATPFDGILEQSRDLICARLVQALAGMLDKSEEILSALASESRSREDRVLYEKTNAVMLAQRKTIETQFQARYLGTFRQRSNKARKIGSTPGDADFSLGSLTIVSDDALEETLRFNDMAAKLRAYCDEELIALDQRVGVLLGDAGLQVDDNPFSPQVICDAYKHACRQADADVGVRRVLLKLFDDYVVDDIRSVYKAVNALLVQNSILPKIRYNLARKDGRKAGTAGGAGSADVSADAHAADGAAQDLFAMLQNLVASNAAGRPGVPAGAGAQAGAGGAAAVLQGAELLGSLTRIQRGDVSAATGGGGAAAAGAVGATNVLHELKGSSVGANMGQMDLMTLDIVAMLFDQLFDDPKVPNGVKGLIGRLQIPMLKVAIADKTFFAKKTHPARQLLDALGDIAMRLPADFSTASALFPRLESILQELVDGFQENFEIFDSVRERLDALLAEDDQRVEQDQQAVVKRVEETENLAVAKSFAQEEVRVRVQTHALPGPVLEFLIQQWLKLLLVLHVKEGQESQTWKDAVEAMDQLIWSVEPKSTREERRKLAALVPGLLKKIAAGLRTAGIEDEVRTQFFADLMKYHTQLISVPVSGSPATAAEAAAGQAGAGGAQQQGGAAGAAMAADSTSLDFSESITVQNPFGGGEVRVDSMDFTGADAGGANAARDASGANLPASLAMGVWVEMREAGDQAARRPLRLIFVSPRKTRYLFAVDRVGKEIIECSRAEISRRFRLGEVRIVDEPPDESLFDRIMNGLVGKLRAPAAAR
jgi:hypothetical protein